MKKLLAILLCVCLLTGLCACGGQPAPGTTAVPDETTAAPSGNGAFQAGFGKVDFTPSESVSMGGYGTWNLLMNHPDVFAAGVPMCGAADPKMAEVLAQIPIWTIHGVKDPTVPVSGSRDMAAAIEKYDPVDFRYTELPDHEHDVWNYTYQNAEIMKWLFSQKKS